MAAFAATSSASSSYLPPQRPTVANTAAVHPHRAASCMADGTAMKRSADMTLGSQAKRAASPNIDRVLSKGQSDLSFHRYAKQIVHTLRLAEQREKKAGAYEPYMRRQPEINEKMRLILVDWLIDVNLKFKLHPEVLYLSINLLDRYLSKVVLKKNTLQLAGCVATMLAAKFEEIFPPEIKEFVSISANTYKHVDMIRMELHMLTVLGFGLTKPTAFHFMKRWLLVCRNDPSLSADRYKLLEHLTHFIAEATLHQLHSLQPSLVAACSVLIARKLLGAKEAWTTNLEHYSGYTLNDLKEPAQTVYALYNKIGASEKATALKRKYGHQKYSYVSNPGRLAELLNQRLHIAEIQELLELTKIEPRNTASSAPFTSAIPAEP